MGRRVADLRGRLMRSGALAPYERALARGGPLGLVDHLGRRHVLHIERWTGGIDSADESVLGRCRGPVLDVGCGPGRLAAALTGRGIAALGIDIAPAAVRAARLRGARVVRRDLFDTESDPLWDTAARWSTILLLDGNIGIGGRPLDLLSRVAAMLAPGGGVIVEADVSAAARSGAGGQALLRAQFEDGAGRHDPVFGWALVTPGAIGRHARQAGLRVAERWTVAGRPFLRLTAAGKR